MFDSNTENPELIWNDTARKNVREAVKKILDKLVTAQSVDPTHKSSQTVTGEQQCAYQSVVDGELIGSDAG